MRTARALVTLLLPACGGWLACDRVPASPPRTGLAIVVTQLPAGSRPADVLPHPSPDRRYPPGSRVVLVPPGAAPSEARVLSGALAAAGAPDVSPDAERVLFAGQSAPGDRWAIYEASLRGGLPRRVFAGDGDCIDPAYLPAGRMVLSCSDGHGDEADGWSLWVASLDGGAAERISFGPGAAFDPTSLADGRILFSLQSAPASGRVGLLTVNPDGALLQAFAGAHDPPAVKARARAIADGGVVFVAADGGTSPPGLRRLDMRRPGGTARRIPLRSAEAGAVELIPAAAEPHPDGGLLVAARRADSGWAVYRVDGDGPGAVRIFDDPDREEVEAIPVLPLPPPRGRPSPLDRSRTTATVVCYDAARSDGVVGPPGGSPAPATFVIERADGGAPELRGRVESDGSFLTEIPADVPVRVRTLDAGGGIIATSSWFWGRPGEVRACFGCHEGHQAAPVNRPVQALLPDERATATGGVRASR